MRARFAVSLALLIPASFPGTSAAACEVGTFTTFATIPAPGHPVGLAVDADRVYVSTTKGNEFTPNLAGEEKIFVLNATGAVISSVRVPTSVGATMGLGDMAVYREGAATRLAIVDMNARFLRSKVTGGAITDVEESSTMPFPYAVAGWRSSMPLAMALAPDGTAYVNVQQTIPTNTIRIWRIPPGGTPSIWFEDARLAGIAPTGARIGPDGKLYFMVGTSERPDAPGTGIVYRLPLVAEPTAADLEEVHRYAAPALLTGLTFGASGRIYVAHWITNDISVLDPAGTEIARYASPLLDSPLGLAFDADGLLIANTNAPPPEDPSHWTVSKMCTGEPGLALNVPQHAAAAKSAKTKPHDVPPGTGSARPVFHCLATSGS